MGIDAALFDQIDALLKAAGGDRLYPPYVVALSTVLRAGELLGLQWVDFDEELGTIQVRRQRVRKPKAEEDKPSIELVEPKTTTGRRRIDLLADVAKTLTHHRASMAREGHANLRDPIFCNKTAYRCTRTIVLEGLGKGGTPAYPLPDLRHPRLAALARWGASQGHQGALGALSGRLYTRDIQ